jgi:predicted RNase H-like HicB family nuclease
MYYIALIHKDADSDYGVSFPDFPGCITAGSTIDEAKDMAKEALQFHIEGIIEDGEAIVQPSSVEEIMRIGESRDAIAFLVEVETPHDKCVRVNITIPLGLLKEATKYASAHGKSRSAFITEAVRDALH